MTSEDSRRRPSVWVARILGYAIGIAGAAAAALSFRQAYVIATPDERAMLLFITAAILLIIAMVLTQDPIK